MSECECFWTPEDQWLSAASCGYGGGYEPGSQMEWNPDCPVHRDRDTCECGKERDSFACKIRHVHLDTSWAKGDH